MPLGPPARFKVSVSWKGRGGADERISMSSWPGRIIWNSTYGNSSASSPAVNVSLNRSLRFKLTFTAGEEAEEFPYVEFQMIRPGQEDIEIRSSAPPLPFQLTLTLNLAGGPSGMKVSYL